MGATKEKVACNLQGLVLLTQSLDLAVQEPSSIQVGVTGSLVCGLGQAQQNVIGSTVPAREFGLDVSPSDSLCGVGRGQENTLDVKQLCLRVTTKADDLLETRLHGWRHAGVLPQEAQELSPQVAALDDDDLAVASVPGVLLHSSGRPLKGSTVGDLVGLAELGQKRKQGLENRGGLHRDNSVELVEVLSIVPR